MCWTHSSALGLSVADSSLNDMPASPVAVVDPGGRSASQPSKQAAALSAIEHRIAEQPVASVRTESPPTALEQTASKVADVPGSARKATAGRGGALLRPRRGRVADWDADAVAAHLMSCQRQMVSGLARRSPWYGLDDETLASCFGHGAAVIARVAATGQRPEWRTTKDLEKAQLAAFRHQALDHWKRVNALSRQGDRFTVAFDAERHTTPDAPLDRLFEQPDLHDIARDLLAELVDEDLRAYWAWVLHEQSSFKEAGDRLGLTKSEVMSFTRAGRAAFAGYLDRRSSGDLCIERSQDVLAHRTGSSTPLRRERAEAHLESCYACALVHERGTSAIQRGILGVAPTPLILRLISRAGDVTAAPVMRIADSGSGSRAVAAGMAAVAVAGSGIGIEAATDAPPKRERPRVSTTQRSESPAAKRISVPSSPPPIVEPTAAIVTVARSPRAAGPTARATRTAAKRRVRVTRPVRVVATPPPQSRPAPPRPLPPQPDEFGFERGSTSAPARVQAPPASRIPTPQATPDPAVDEFGTP